MSLNSEVGFFLVLVVSTATVTITGTSGANVMSRGLADEMTKGTTKVPQPPDQPGDYWDLPIVMLVVLILVLAVAVIWKRLRKGQPPHYFRLLPSVKPFQCGILYQSEGDSVTKKAVESLVSNFNDRRSFELQVRDFYRLADATSPPVTYVLVPCLIQTRLGTDIERNVKAHFDLNTAAGSNIVLLVLHHRQPHNTHVTPTSSIMGNSDIIRPFKCVIDVLFNTDDGVFICDANDRAMNELEDICRGH